MSDISSVHSIESVSSDGCPVSPSILYDQRALFYETLKKQKRRNAMTEYRSRRRKSLVIVVGGGNPWTSENDISRPTTRSIKEKSTTPLKKSKTESSYRIPQSLHYIHQKDPLNLAMISICT